MSVHVRAGSAGIPARLERVSAKRSRAEAQARMEEKRLKLALASLGGQDARAPGKGSRYQL